MDWAGAGVAWPRSDEMPEPTRGVASLSISQQRTRNACGPACAQMLLRDRGIHVFQSQVAAVAGRVLTSPVSLALALNTFDSTGGIWYGLGVSIESIVALNQTGPWVAMTMGRPRNHWVVVDGWDNLGNLKIRDPWDATRYIVRINDFIEFWTGFAVFKRQ